MADQKEDLVVLGALYLHGLVRRGSGGLSFHAFLLLSYHRLFSLTRRDTQFTQVISTRFTTELNMPMAVE